MWFSPRCCSAHELFIHANVTLQPDPRLAVAGGGALGAALLPLPLHPWPTLVVALFGVFLLIQTASLRLEFEERALIVWQNGRELRRFPYDQWLTWRLFAPWLPGLVLFPRNPEHPLPADPVQPKAAAGTTGATRRRAGGAETGERMTAGLQGHEPTTTVSAIRRRKRDQRIDLLRQQASALLMDHPNAPSVAVRLLSPW